MGKMKTWFKNQSLHNEKKKYLSKDHVTDKQQAPLLQDVTWILKR